MKTMSNDSSSRTETLAVVLPIDMGNYGQNLLSVKETFIRLAAATSSIRFVKYHWRRSGNFLFIAEDTNAVQIAASIAQQVTGLPCLVRTIEQLRAVLTSLPSTVQATKRGSYFLMTADGPRKVIHVALSHDIQADERRMGTISPRVSVLSWPSGRDLLCLYLRPSRGGDVGQVTNAVLKAWRKTHYSDRLHGTGRAIGVIHDLVHDDGLLTE